MNVNVFGRTQWELLEALAVSASSFPDHDYDHDHDTGRVPTVDAIPTTTPPAATPALFQAPAWHDAHTVAQYGGSALFVCILLSPPCHLCADSIASFVQSHFGQEPVQDFQAVLAPSSSAVSLQQRRERVVTGLRDAVPATTVPLDARSPPDTILLGALYTLHNDVNLKLDEQCRRNLPARVRDGLDTTSPIFRNQHLSFPVFRRRIQYETRMGQDAPRLERLIIFLHAQFAFTFAKYDAEPWARRTSFYALQILRVLFVMTRPTRAGPDASSLCRLFRVSASLYTAVQTWTADVFAPLMQAGRVWIRAAALAPFLRRAWRKMLRQPALWMIAPGPDPDPEHSHDVQRAHLDAYRRILHASSCEHSRCL